MATYQGADIQISFPVEAGSLTHSYASGEMALLYGDGYAQGYADGLAAADTSAAYNQGYADGFADGSVFYRMRAWDITLGRYVYWTVQGVVDDLGLEYTGPGPLIDIVAADKAPPSI